MLSVVEGGVDPLRLRDYEGLCLGARVQQRDGSPPEGAEPPAAFGISGVAHPARSAPADPTPAAGLDGSCADARAERGSPLADPARWAQKCRGTRGADVATQAPGRTRSRTAHTLPAHTARTSTHSRVTRTASTPRARRRPPRTPGTPVTHTFRPSLFLDPIFGHHTNASN